MGSAASGRTVTANADTDRINDRLADLRDELREAMVDETTALTSLRQTELAVSRANTHVKHCSAEIGRWQRELGDHSIVIDELDPIERTRANGLTIAAPVARFDHAVKDEAKRRKVG